MSRQKSQRELEQIQQNLEYSGGELRVFIADILPVDIEGRQQMEDRMLELENLVKTYGGVVILKHIQNKTFPDYKTFIGAGKLDDIVTEMKQHNANILILGNILKSKQVYAINDILKPIGAKAWDRVDLILKIFERHAKSAEAKLQIELAAIKHMGPRIYDMGMELGKQGGKGKGETNTEIMKRHLRKKEQAIRKQLEQYEKVRSQHRQGRNRKGLTTIGVVGYTNAGKSTLTNTLTKKGVLAEDKLFATLGTSVGKLWIPKPDGGGVECLINDTIGFIRELPPTLIDAFSSTLEDSIESDILLHVIDASDPKMDIKIKVVDDILSQIGASQPRIYVFNKIDDIPQGEYIDESGEKNIVYDGKLSYIREKYQDHSVICISAVEKTGIPELQQLFLEHIHI